MARGPIPDRSASRPTVSDVLPLVEAYYVDHPTGGSLHIVLDDGNLADRHVEFCRDFARERGDARGVRIATALLRMTRTQRRRIYRRS